MSNYNVEGRKQIEKKHTWNQMDHTAELVK